MAGIYIDIAILLYLLLASYYGSRRRLADAAFDLASVSVAILIALATFQWTADFLTRFLRLTSDYTYAFGFFANAFLIKWILVFIFDNTSYGRIAVKDARLARLLSGLLSFGYSFLILLIFFAVLYALPVPAFIARTVSASETGAWTETDPSGLNKAFGKIFGRIYEAALDDFNFLSVKSGEEGRSDLGFTTTQTSADAEAELQMLGLINQERKANGLNPLVMDQGARTVARQYGTYLFAQGFISHTDLAKQGPADRMKKSSNNFLLIGENLAYAHSVAEAHTGLMKSSGHRDNILHPYFNRAGIGVINSGPHGIIFVQEFLN